MHLQKFFKGVNRLHWKVFQQYYSTLLYFNLKTSVDAHLQDTVHSQTVHSLSIYMYAHERESKQS